ncbi:serine hydrolase domain-containing protein [Paenibacillus harenae]|uniref:serine hydrolase domain-containing protein n=1 Tax=Paenibacillus harenae TaxID=306543 RepID=UPI000412D5F5|nr:serine hydrolase [Paenibacillus harenae]
MSLKYSLPRSTPEKQGISSSGILKFLEAVEQSNLELHSFMLVRNGHVTAEGWWAPYKPKIPHMLFSLTKSFTSTGVGFAVSEGLLTLEDKVISFFPEYASQNTEKNLGAMKVRDLLTMSAGHLKPTMGSEWRQMEGGWIKHFLEIPIDHEPGTRFVYNSGATYMLAAIVQKVTGQMLLDYLEPRLFEPLGIDVSEWDTCPAGINTGGWGLSLKTEDLARFGQLYLQEGLWNGTQLLPKEWIREATSCQINNEDGQTKDWQQGYGYQFWRSVHNAYRADGAFGQLCLVLPDQNAVIATTGGHDKMQELLDLIWNYLLQAMDKHMLPENEVVQTPLAEKLGSLSLFPSPGHSESVIAASITGKLFEIEENADRVQLVAFYFEKDFCTFFLWDHRGVHHIKCGIGEWIEGITTMTGNALHHQYQPAEMRVISNGTWKDENTFIMTWFFVEMPFSDTVVCHFQGDRLRLERTVNVPASQKDVRLYWGK